MLREQNCKKSERERQTDDLGLISLSSISLSQSQFFEALFGRKGCVHNKLIYTQQEIYFFLSFFLTVCEKLCVFFFFFRICFPFVLSIGEVVGSTFCFLTFFFYNKKLELWVAIVPTLKRKAKAMGRRTVGDCAKKRKLTVGGEGKYPHNHTQDWHERKKWVLFFFSAWIESVGTWLFFGSTGGYLIVIRGRQLFKNTILFPLLFLFRVLVP